MFSFLTTVFHVFSSLIEFFHVGNFLHPDCFFPAILLGTSFLCYCNVSATDLKEHFLFSGVFYLTLLPHICHSIASATDLRKFILSSGVFYLKPSFPTPGIKASRLPWESAVLPLMLQCIPLTFETQTRPIYLNHTVFSKRY